ncbi:MAG: division/cell wall cluster transcriptional repressor MraZ [Pseudomonadota bacterium]
MALAGTGALALGRWDRTIGVRTLSGKPKYRYRGTYFSARGEKDRFVLPADFRKTVTESSDKRLLCLSRDTRFPCLVGYGLSRQDEIDDEIDRQEELATQRGEMFDREVAELSSSAMVFETGFDASGRFIFPLHARILAKISDKALFIGSGSQFQIWDPDVLLAYDTDIPRLLDAKMLIPHFAEEAGGRR